MSPFREKKNTKRNDDAIYLPAVLVWESRSTQLYTFNIQTKPNMVI